MHTDENLLYYNIIYIIIIEMYIVQEMNFLLSRIIPTTWSSIGLKHAFKELRTIIYMYRPLASIHRHMYCMIH